MDHNSIKKFLNQGTTTERTRITNSNALRTSSTLPDWRVSCQGEFHEELGGKPSYCEADLQAHVGQSQLRNMELSLTRMVDKVHFGSVHVGHCLLGSIL